MKKIDSIGFVMMAGLMAAVSCEKEMGLQEPVSEGIIAVMDADAPVTKAIMIDNPGVKVESFWEAGDRIGVFGDGGSNVQFSVAEADLSEDKKTALFKAASDTPAGDLTSYFPYQDGADCRDGLLKVVFPEKQAYTVVGGLVQADPDAAVKMACGSRNGGLAFRNVFAILKIGQVFEEDIVVKSVEFRDLAGTAVSGKTEIEWNGGSPVAKVVGEGKTIVLDCGSGVSAKAGAVSTFFMVVPAREYPKGFEISFVADDGTKTVRTAGSVQGKTLSRGIVYMIGDATSVRIPAEGSSSELYPTARVMDSEALDLFTVTDILPVNLYDDEGNACYDERGNPLYRPQISGIAHKSLDPVEGGWMIFTEPTADLPAGGVYKIEICEQLDADHYEVVLQPEANVAAPFKEMTAGTPIYDESGNFIEGGGIDLDLAGALAEIVTEEGVTVPYSVSSSGAIQFTPEATALLFKDCNVITDNVCEPDTKAILNKGISTPKMSLSLHGDNAEAMFGAVLHLQMKAAAKMHDGEVHYIHFTASPKLDLSADFSLSAKAELSLDMHLITLRFVPIAIAPGVLLSMSLEISGKVGIGGEIKLSTSLSYTHDLGRFGFSYLNGDGFTGRHSVTPIENPPKVEPSFGGISGNLYAYGSLIFTPTIGIYGLVSTALDTELKLQFGLEYTPDERKVGELRKLYLTPSLELTPSVAALGGWLTHKFKELSLKVDFDPLWEQYLDPDVSGSCWAALKLSPASYVFDYHEDPESSGTITQVYTGVDNVHYDLTLKHALPVTYDLYLEEMFGTPEYVPYPGKEALVSQILASGAPNMFYFGNAILKCMYPEYSGNREYIGTYEAGTETNTFTGTLPFEGTSGKALKYVPVLESKEGDRLYLSDFGSTPRIYYWPNDSNGNEYELYVPDTSVEE